MSSLDQFRELMLRYGLSVAAALAIFVIGKWVARLLSRLVEQAMVRSRVNRTLASFAKNIAYCSILTFVTITALNKLGIDTNSFIAVIGAAGFAVGLALQGSLANFAAGVMLIIFQPFQVGDVIEAGGAAGTVEEIQIFSTVICTNEARIIIPNAKITSDKITVFQTK